MHQVNNGLDTGSPLSMGGSNQNQPECLVSTGPLIRRLPKRDFNVDIRNAFGPDPDAVVRCFVDLGLTNGEIGRYVGLPEVCINMLTRRLRGPELGRYPEQ